MCRRCTTEGTTISTLPSSSPTMRGSYISAESTYGSCRNTATLRRERSRFLRWASHSGVPYRQSRSTRFLINLGDLPRYNNLPRLAIAGAKHCSPTSNNFEGTLWPKELQVARELKGEPQPAKGAECAKEYR